MLIYIILCQVEIEVKEKVKISHIYGWVNMADLDCNLFHDLPKGY